ncbi:MAG: aspartyl protease family protein [Candidatus Eisenbacteria bacterium]|nr:aspartyl protease family protein [Candidatus Eisenbacteria bacterium]
MTRRTRIVAAALALALSAAPGANAAPSAVRNAPEKTNPDLQQVLRRHADALGGLEKLRALKCVWGEGTISVGGLNGTLRAYMEFPGRMRNEFQIASLRQVVVQDGGSAWMVDQNGQVKEMTGQELRNLQDERCVSAYRYLLAPDEATVRFSTATPESAQYINLDVVPAGGKPVRLCLDPVTYLPRKMIQVSAMGEAQTYLSDYREVAGVKMSFRSVQMLGGDATRAITVTTDKSAAVPTLPDTLWRRPGASARDWELAGGAGSVTLPAEIVNHHVFVQGRVNASPPMYFLLDSGAGATVVERSVADSLGLKTEGKLGAQGVGGTTDFGFTQVDSLVVGGVKIGSQRIIAIALPGIRALLDRPLAGILGYDFLSRFAVSVDYSGKQVTFSDPAAWQAPESAHAVAMELVHNVPVVTASCDGIPGRFVVDTGNNGSLLLHGPFVREHRLMENTARKLQVRVRGAGGEETNTTVRMKSFELGGFTLANPLVSLSSSQRGVTGGSSELAGNIGGWLLEQFRLTLDYKGRKLWLQPGRLFGEAMNVGRLGWQVAKLDGQLRVVGVAPGTPAADAGVEEGDLLMTLEDQDIHGLTGEMLRKVTDQPAGTKLTFGLKRAGEEKVVQVTLRDIL